MTQTLLIKLIVLILGVSPIVGFVWSKNKSIPDRLLDAVGSLVATATAMMLLFFSVTCLLYVIGVTP